MSTDADQDDVLRKLKKVQVSTIKVEYLMIFYGAILNHLDDIALPWKFPLSNLIF